MVIISVTLGSPWEFLYPESDPAPLWAAVKAVNWTKALTYHQVL